MDPFSVSVGITNLVVIAEETLSIVNEYLSESRRAKESAITLVKELEALQSNLSSLETFLRSESITSRELVFEQTSILRSRALSCENKLKFLSEKLGQVGNNKESRDLWPLSSKEHQMVFQELRTFTQWIHLALNVEGSAQLTQTSNDAPNTISQHLQSFETLQNFKDKTTSLQDAVTDPGYLLQEDIDSKARAEILNTISDLDQKNRHHNVRLLRAQGTGIWFLERTEYVRWRDGISDSNTLWCHGIQGCGKSVLTSLVVDDLRCSLSTKEEEVIFFYFDYRNRDTQTPVYFVSSCVRQLVARLPNIPKTVTDLYKEYPNATNPPPLHKLVKLLIHTTSNMSKVHIIVDALDECDELLHRKPILQILYQLSMKPNIRLLITSRPPPYDIKTTFLNSPQVLIQAKDSDIQRYIRHQLNNADLLDISSKFISKIVDTLTERARGLFLLPVLQLRTILKEPTIGEMEDKLESLSHTLSEAFEETITRIYRLPEGRKKLAMSALMWISHTKRPLTAPELCEALSVKPNQSHINYKYRPSPKMIVECCQGLVVLDTKSPSIRLTHSTIQEYLTTRSRALFPDGESELASSCLTYLLSNDFQRDLCHSEEGIESRLQRYPFLSYASSFWDFHTRNSIGNTEVLRLASLFLDSRVGQGQAHQIRCYERGLHQMYWEPGECLSGTKLHTACKFGLEPIVRTLLDEQGVIINARSKMGNTPIMSAASTPGNSHIVALLLERGADPYLGHWYGNALHCAAEAGCSAAIYELLKHGMDPDEVGGEPSRRPISCTLDNDSLAAFETLVEAGADMNPDGNPVFHEAFQWEAVDIINFILQMKETELEMRSTGGQTAMHFAARGGNTTILSGLIEAGANVNAQDEEGRTPIDYVVTSRLSEEVFYILKEHGAVSGGKGQAEANEIHGVGLN